MGSAASLAPTEEVTGRELVDGFNRQRAWCESPQRCCQSNGFALTLPAPPY
jgi:hypothetical protein